MTDFDQLQSLLRSWFAVTVPALLALYALEFALPAIVLVKLLVTGQWRHISRRRAIVATVLALVEILPAPPTLSVWVFWWWVAFHIVILYWLLGRLGGRWLSGQIGVVVLLVLFAFPFGMLANLPQTAATGLVLATGVGAVITLLTYRLLPAP